MKKFLFFILLLIILGAAGFFLGWTHLTVPPGSYGVMRSKTHGLESLVIQDGEFRWLWYKMIPTNAEVIVFNINPVRRTIRSTGTLASGQAYASLSGLEADFSWDISGEIRFNLRPELLPELVSRELVKSDLDLRQFEEELAFRIETMILGRIKAYADNDDEEALETLILTGSLPGLDNEIIRAFPEIENLHCIFRVVRLPDFVLYRSTRGLYREYMEQQSFVLRQDILREAQNRIETRIRLDELAQYGELLTRYPVLLELMALENTLIPALNIGN